MGIVIDFKAERDKRVPHASGSCICLACRHDFVAVVPLPLPTGGFIECPACGQQKATLAPFYPEQPAMVCDCGNFIFFVFSEALMCPVCARTYER